MLDADRVLLVKRGHEPLKGTWSLPGGVVELGESLQAALARELREETTLAVEVGPIVDVFERIERASDGRVAYHYVVVDYLCRVREGVPAHGSDVDDARWVDRGDLAAYRLTEKTTAVIEKAFRLRQPLGFQSR